jgi:hypothetical protein
MLASVVVVCPPTWIDSNSETASTNAYQHAGSEADRLLAQEQFRVFVCALREAGIDVLELDPPSNAPDAVFPHTGFSTQPDGTLVLYPMLAESRRQERDPAGLRQVLLSSGYRVEREVDFTALEIEGEFLEGTGSLVMDHANRHAYAALSPRTTPRALRVVCAGLGYAATEFRAEDQGMAVYHTNVVMAVGSDFAVVCREAIADPRPLDESLGSTGKKVIDISREQMRAFCGNILELAGPVVLMSSQAYAAFDPAQLAILEEGRRIVHADISAIEQLGGGSARCMVAEVFLPSAG